MPFPFSPTDAFETGALLGTGKTQEVRTGFGADVPPTPSGLGSRQSRIRNDRIGISRRKLMRWMVPEQPIVQMYMNPQQITYQYRKQVSETRTKGGYVLQYWGEEITGLNVNGTTGSSGIEGINVLYDIYRNEQLMFDPFALFLQAEQEKVEDQDSDFLGLGFLDEVGSLFGSPSGSPASNPGTRNKPTLASMAFTVELYWSGEVYRGYFKDFTVTESAQNIGMFDYTMSFRVTQKRGFRTNFFPWHRSATDGPSDSRLGGTPHSFRPTAVDQATPGRNAVDQPDLGTAYVDGFGQSGRRSRRTGAPVLDPYEV